jgi:HSP20 family protein
MNVRDLIPWSRGSASQVPAVFRDLEQSPLLSLHRDVNRLFDDFFRGFDIPSAFGRFPTFGATWPNVEIADTDKEIRILAEVPGLEEKDIEVLLDDGVLTLRGEKKSETEDKDRQFSERFYGRFERRIPVGAEVEQDKVSATFKNGLLTVTLPKTERVQSKAKRIAINDAR